ncbi:MAG: hypothetical protein EOM24_29595 [Chloroflexia bacterium]|nr:hypothetical protein [Chloroflexia bacterium]
MADAQSIDTAARKSDDLVDVTEAFSKGLAQMGVLAVSWPFYFLPAKERDDAIATTTRLFTSVGELHLNLVRNALRSLGDAVREVSKPADAPTATAPHRTTTKVPIETAPSVKR